MNTRDSSTTGTKRRATVGSIWSNAVAENFYEVQGPDPLELGAWVYTEKLSYVAGDIVGVHTSTTAKMYALQIYRDGASATEVLSWNALPGCFHSAPVDASVHGCGWRRRNAN